MARAETIESAAETRGGGNGPLSHHSNSCCNELPRPLNTWPGLLTTATIATSARPGSGAILHLQHNHLHPLQAFYVSYPLPYPHPEGRDEPQTHQQLPALSPSTTPPLSPLCTRRATAASSDFSGEQSDSDREEHHQASGRHGPQNLHPPWASPHHRAPEVEALQELDIRRVAHQLRTIGDEFNAAVHRRMHVNQWQDWRDVCRGLLNFITQTLSTLYRLT